MKKLLIGFVFAVSALAQSAPNCNQQNAVLSTAATGTPYNATSIKCTAWTFSYFAEGFSALSVQVESAPDVSGAPGAFVAIPAANIKVGVNPSTTTTFNVIIIQGYFPWLRVNLTSATGTGFLNYTLIGNSYIGPNSSVSSSSSGGTTTVVGTVAAGVNNTGNNPVEVQGQTPAGSVVVANPTTVGGVDGSNNVRNLGINGNGAASITGFTFTGADGNAGNPFANLSGGAGFGMLAVGQFMENGSTWDRIRSLNLLTTFQADGTKTGSNIIGVQQIDKPGRFVVNSNPAAGSQATASVAAEASVRHVIDCLQFSAANTTAIGAAQLLLVNVRDGATGAGTILRSYELFIPVGPGQAVAPQHICGLQLAGTTNTAMTVEFSAGVANLVESVDFTFFNIN